MKKRGILPWIFLLSACACSAHAQQQRLVSLAFGDFDRWLVREIKESGVIGGNIVTLYEIAPNDTVRGQIAYKNTKSPWASSNVYAKVSGVTKASVSVFPEARGNGRCARLDTRFQTVKVLGMINMSVLAPGSIFLGEMLEPVSDTKNPMEKLNMGVPFTDRPQAIQFDYKMKATGEPNRIKATGFGAQKTVPGPDYADVTLMLQKRWEDADGNVFAKRVGTANERYGTTTADWINNHQVKILYGDITKNADYKPQMGLIPVEKAHYCRNSKGKMVPIQEVGWATADEAPTHLILQFSSSYDEAYIGSVGNSFWVDNVKLAY